jgi:excisionase family DNA binding protein
MRRRVVERLGLESDMRRALERGEFTLFFQPIVSTAERRIAGVEALVRWEHPELGVVPPSAFIPVAEESGLIVPLGRWVLNEACRRLARWLADPAIDVPYLSVNISGRQLADPALPDEVASVLRRTGVPADRLALEITESVLIGGTASPTAVLQRLEQLGVRLLLDDFGTGYSSLNYLKRLPVQALKVDRSFIAGITEDAEDRHILRAIVDMAAASASASSPRASRPSSRPVRPLAGLRDAAGLPLRRPRAGRGDRADAPRRPPARPARPAFAPTAPATRAALPAAAADPEPGPPPATADDGPSVALSEAAQALSVSTSTLRRWADAGRIRSVRTAGGHRRFPVAEIRRLNSEGRACGSPVVRAVALPAEPLPALAALLRDATAEISDASARALYERPRLGWFASDDGEAQVRRWALAVAAAAQDGSFDGAIDATAQLLAQAHYAGASLLERHTFIERYGDVAVRALQQRNAPHAELIAARRLYVRLRQALLDEPFAGRA